MPQIVWIVLGAAAGLIVLLFVLALIWANRWYNRALNSRCKKPYLPENAVSSEEEKAWFRETARPTAMRARDSLRLQGYLLEGDDSSQNWVILAHGYNSCAADLAHAAIAFRKEGYHVLAVDLRAHGLSDGSCIGMGWPDRLDLAQWAEVIAAKHPGASIALYGVGMGAAAVLMATGAQLPKQVKCAAAFGGYSSALELFESALKARHIPRFPLLPLTSLMTRLRGGYTLGQASCIIQLPKSRTPTLFLYQEDDPWVTKPMAERVFAAAACEKQLLFLPDTRPAEHSGYWGDLFAFLARYMGVEKTPENKTAPEAE